MLLILLLVPAGLHFRDTGSCVLDEKLHRSAEKSSGLVVYRSAFALCVIQEGELLDADGISTGDVVLYVRADDVEVKLN